jgi:hypothetical protein
MSRIDIKRWANQHTFNGFMLGLIVPWIVFIGLYLMKYEHLPFNEYFHRSMSYSSLPVIIKFCVFGNLPFFLLFNFMKRFEFCMGIFAATILYIIPMFLVRYVL